jgi:Tol biopolymer transport system component
MRRFVLLLSLVSVAVLLASGVGVLLPPKDAQAAFPGDNGRIVFSSDRHSNNDQNYEIYSMKPDGSDQKRLTNNTAMDIMPSFSPDGKHITFARGHNGGNFDIYVMRVDGANAIRLTDNPNIDFEPVWSPDGNHIAFRSERDGNSEIYSMNANGNNQTNLTNNPKFDTTPSWSPDGTKIAYSSNSGVLGNYEIFVMNSNGSSPENVTNNRRANSHPDWSPDGTKLVFMSISNNAWQTYTMDADGANQVRLINESSLYPSWSPDGKKIAFTSSSAGSDEIHSINADGSEKTNLTNNLATDRYSTWQPQLGSENLPPTITDLQPTPNSSTPERKPKIEAAVRDDHTELLKEDVNLTLDKKQITTFTYNQGTDKLSYTPPKNLSVGNHTVKIVAKDAEGLNSTQTWTFSVSRR